MRRRKVRYLWAQVKSWNEISKGNLSARPPLIFRLNPFDGSEGRESEMRARGKGRGGGGGGPTTVVRSVYHAIRERN